MSDTPLPRRGMSVADAARVLGVHPDTVRNMIADGTLRARQPRGPRTRVVVFAEDVDRFFEEADAQPVVIEKVDADLPVGDPAEAKRQIATDLREGKISTSDAAALLRLLGGAA